jgi:serine/threonine protein kinase
MRKLMRAHACRDLRRFAVSKLIGRGYASRVYAALDAATNTLMALKVYRKADLCPLNVHQIRRETVIHAALAHDTVLPLFAAFEDNASIFMALEFCEKGDLYNYLKSKGRALSEMQV